LATDGSGEAELATRTAVDLARMSGSELHVIHVLDAPNPTVLYPEYTDPEAVGTTVLLTGATDGLGRRVARELAAKGAAVLAHWLYYLEVPL